MSNKNKDNTSIKGSNHKNKNEESDSQKNKPFKLMDKSTYISPKSVSKIFRQTTKISPKHILPNNDNSNLNESTYGNFTEAKGFSTSIYKKVIKKPQFEENKLEQDQREQKEHKDQSNHSHFYLNSKGFRVIEKVGYGNYAKVYRVINPENKEMAVKIIDLYRTSQNYRSKFLPRELEILTRLNHRNITKVYEIIKLPKYIYIFMEFAPNGTVADFLRVYRAIPENFCQMLFHRIVDALWYLHKLHIAHRDLKLENILIDKQGQPKLTDFSYSLICKADKSGKMFSQTFCGSLPYIPPEVLQECPYDPKIADIWSLGICLYVMLNDGLPFKFNDITHMLKCQLTKNWKFKSRVINKLSDEVKDLIKQMLEPDFKIRLNCYNVINHSWLTEKKFII